MTDIVDAATRSRMMSGIRGKNTKPELLVRSLLHQRGFRFRLHRKDLPGKPDIVLPRHKAVIFVNGCFWHGHSCRLFKTPSTNTDSWIKKIRENQNRDERCLKALLGAGWRVAVIWECALKGQDSDIAGTINQISEWIVDGGDWMEVQGKEK
ncbi:MAG TPA: DNA mismatch endonuclease Vsr [Hydrogenophaga sp.]|uniref:very short patch repair endonuclease n=1 Tax=Hydrogenophaga sp. TaxID=1904254 RepID=UPI002B997651|nr:DNA mismatch endonuclease Vsr [Hydrogenophaga sp.]HMN92803.1 DNA mismatch endonuclease Vsr [Hydrogenophaga sp.]HMP10356.1 DNA mismatch endonuclease Vsr [Hydrogenophaga sp.]